MARVFGEDEIENILVRRGLEMGIQPSEVMRGVVDALAQVARDWAYDDVTLRQAAAWRRVQVSLEQATIAIEDARKECAS